MYIIHVYTHVLSGPCTTACPHPITDSDFLFASLGQIWREQLVDMGHEGPGSITRRALDGHQLHLIEPIPSTN